MFTVPFFNSGSKSTHFSGSTFNAQPPKVLEADAHWMFDVGFWMLDVQGFNARRR
jgi:hypothetical protein